MARRAVHGDSHRTWLVLRRSDRAASERGGTLAVGEARGAPCRATRGAPAADGASIWVAEGRWLAVAAFCVDRLRMAARGSGRRKRRLAVAPVKQARRTGVVSEWAQGGCIGPKSGGGHSRGG